MVETKDLYKDYRAGKVIVPALRGVNMRIEDGEFTAIAGPSGSGKTTLLNIIGYLDTPTRGDVFVDGTSGSKLSAKEKAEFRKKELGFVFQTFNLIPVLSAYENAEIPLILLNVAPDERRERVVAILEEVGLGELISRRPNELSGGQQQRIAIARALVKNPSMVLADEPTANLDSTTGREILGLMRDLNEKLKTTFVFSTHDELVMNFARRLILLRDGKVVGEERK